MLKSRLALRTLLGAMVLIAMSATYAAADTLVLTNPGIVLRDNLLAATGDQITGVTFFDVTSGFITGTNDYRITVRTPTIGGAVGSFQINGTTTYSMFMSSSVALSYDMDFDLINGWVQNGPLQFFTNYGSSLIVITNSYINDPFGAAQWTIPGDPNATGGATWKFSQGTSATWNTTDMIFETRVTPVSGVPEPSSLGLLGIGLALGIYRRVRKSR